MPETAPATIQRRVMSQRDQDLVLHIEREFAEYQTQKSNYNQQYEEISGLILPTFRGTFNVGGMPVEGSKQTDQQVDATGMVALSRFAAICDSLLTPRNMTWAEIEADNPLLMKDRAVKLYYEEVNRVLFKERYKATANFSSQNLAIYQSLGAFGTGALFIDELADKHGVGLRYSARPLGEIFLRENFQGRVDGFIRYFRLTARQAYQLWPATFPSELESALALGSQTKFEFLQRVCPNEEYDHTKLDYRGMDFSSTYICRASKSIMEEGGYRTLPGAFTRYEQAPGEVYGRSPAMMVLPSLKTLNAQKKVFLKQGHRAADPVLLTSEDGVVDFNMRPGALNKGGVNSDGKPLVHILPTGEIQVSLEMMQEEKGTIQDVFLTTLFQILVDSGKMTATEVIERTNEKGILLAPTVGRQQSEYIGPMIEREIDILAYQRKLPPMPDILREAKGEYSVVHTSPLSRAAKAQEVAGFMRTVEMTTNIVNVTGDPSPMDNFDFDEAIPEIATVNAAPTRWMASDEKIASKRKARADIEARKQSAQELPGKAAMMKAQAVAGQQPPAQ